MLRLNPQLADSLEPAELPVLPQVLLRLLDLLDQGAERAPVERISRYVFADAGLAARALALTARNGVSPRAFPRNGALERLLAPLGEEVVGMLLLAAATRHLLAAQAQEPPPARQWALEALQTAHMARALAAACAYPRPDEAYLAGLFHNLGRQALAAAEPQRYARLLAEGGGRGALAKAEAAAFGHDYAEAGAWMVRRWGLGGFLADAVQYHAAPAAALRDAHPLVRIAHAAHRLCGGDAPPPQAERSGLVDLLELEGEEDLSRAEAYAGEQQRALAEDLGLEPEAPERLGAATSQAAARRLVIHLGDRARLAGLQELLRAAGGEEGMLRAAARGAEALFGLRRVLFFLHDANPPALRGHDPLDPQGPAGDLRLAPRPDGSAVGRALLTRRPTLCSADAGQTQVVDQQILALLDTQAMLCIPMLVGEARIGVMVIGAGRQAAEALSGQAEALARFARALAQALEDHRAQARRESDRVAEAGAEIRAKIRQIVHEANNPLAVLRNYLAILGRKLDAEAGVQEELRMLEEEVERMGSLLQRLRDPEEGREGQGAVDLNRLIKESLQLIAETGFMPESIEASTSFDPALPPIRTDGSAVKQILLNLLKNAVEAMPEGGQVWLRTRDYVYLDAREYVEIGIADSGPGIPPHVLARLFQPVESTKGPGHSGLGLSIVRHLVRELNGLISCHSSATQGTAFRILLPRELEV